MNVHGLRVRHGSEAETLHDSCLRKRLCHVIVRQQWSLITGVIIMADFGHIPHLVTR